MKQTCWWVKVKQFAKQVTSNYLAAVANNDWGTASQLLNQIKSYQRQEGGQIIPSDTKIKLEVLYHKADVFSKLSKISFNCWVAFAPVTDLYHF
jgi:hypothetical protein